MPAAAYLWYSRSLSMALFLAAAIVNALAVKALKRLLAQPRPAASPEQGDYGMPSSHAASLFFFALALPDSALADAASKFAAPMMRPASREAVLAKLRALLARARSPVLASGLAGAAAPPTAAVEVAPAHIQ